MTKVRIKKASSPRNSLLLGDKLINRKRDIFWKVFIVNEDGTEDLLSEYITKHIAVADCKAHYFKIVN